MLIPPLTAPTASDLEAALAPFSGREVTLEGVLPGVYLQALRTGDEISVWDAEGSDVTEQYPHWVGALKSFDCESAHVEGIDAPTGPMLSDLLAFDGADYTVRTLRERLAMLSEAAPAHLMPERVTTDLAAWASAFVTHIKARGYVGLLVRDPQAARVPGTAVLWGETTAAADEIGPYDGMCSPASCD